MRIGEFTASVIIDGRPLQEYDSVMENRSKSTCWIPSEEGKNFTVQWKCHSKTRRKGNRGCLVVDGVRCRGNVMAPGPLGKYDTMTRSCVSNDTKKRDFIFSRLQLSDDDALLDKSVPTNLGEISLTISHGKAVKVLRKPRADEELNVPNDDDKFHETAKKATVHRMNFGPEKPAKHKKYNWNFTRDGSAKLVFVFKYRPLDVLQANGIAPLKGGTDHNARSEVEPADDDIEALDGPYIPDIKPKISGPKNELKRLRSRRGSVSEDRKPKRVKQELGTETRPVFLPGEVIDLT